MNLAPLVFGVVLSSLYGSAFHLLRGGGLGRLVYYLVLGWIGFWTGHFLASRLGVDFFTVGQLHLGLATLVSMVFLVVGSWLGPVKRK
jgi:hypothetical protein